MAAQEEQHVQVRSPKDQGSSDRMIVAAARLLPDGCVCFVGIGLPSAAANLARNTHAPRLVLIYESGTIGARPTTLPLSIGDGELAETAQSIVSVPEMFHYWLGGGRIDIGFLSAAQMDRFGNLNSTVIGDYARPKVRLPGAGGAPEIAAYAKKTLIVMRHDRRAFVERLDFVTSAGHLGGGAERAERGLTGSGPYAVVTDLGLLVKEEGTSELVLAALHEGVTEDEVRAATGWKLRIADRLTTLPPPTAAELGVLRRLESAAEPVSSASQAAIAMANLPRKEAS